MNYIRELQVPPLSMAVQPYTMIIALHTYTGGGGDFVYTMINMKSTHYPSLIST